MCIQVAIMHFLNHLTTTSRACCQGFEFPFIPGSQPSLSTHLFLELPLAGLNLVVECPLLPVVLREQLGLLALLETLEEILLLLQLLPQELLLLQLGLIQLHLGGVEEVLFGMAMSPFY